MLVMTTLKMKLMRTKGAHLDLSNKLFLDSKRVAVSVLRGNKTCDDATQTGR